MKSYIQPGDIIYFYTDKDKFSLDSQIEYMVVITEQLVNATVTELIQNAVEKPMSYKYTEQESIKDSEYVVSNINTVSVFYDCELSDKKLGVFGKSLSNFIIRRSDSPVALGSYSAEEQQKLMEMSYNVKNDIEQNINLTFSNRVDETGKSVEIKASDAGETIALKINDLYLKEDNIGNVELVSQMTDNVSYLYYDYSGYLYNGFTRDNYSDSKRLFTLHRELFLYDEENATESLICGYVKVRFCQRDVMNNLYEPDPDKWKFMVDFSDEKCQYEEEYIFTDTVEVSLQEEQFDYIETDRRGRQFDRTGWCSFMLRTFAQDENGSRHWSRETYAVWDEENEKFVVFTPGLDTGDVTDETDDSIKFSFSGLSVDATDKNQIP